MKLGGKEYQPVTPTGQRCKQWRVDLDGQWRQHHGTSKFVWSFRWVRLNTGIAHFFFFFFQCKPWSRAFWLYYTVWGRQEWARVPCLYEPGVLRTQFHREARRELLPGKGCRAQTRGSTAPSRRAEGGLDEQELERSQGQAGWPEQPMPQDEGAA